MHRVIRHRLYVALATVLGLLSLAASPVLAAAAEPPDAKTVDAIRNYIRRELTALHVPGAAVVIVHGDEIVYAEGFGRAEPDGTPVTPQTPFLIASVSKPITALAVMQQIEAGHLALDARVSDYLPWFGANGSGSAAITVRDLLAHTSGWTGGDGQLSRLDEADDDGALERNVRRLGETAPSHIGHFEGSDANYDVLGLLVATVSGERYEDYVRHHILDSLDMRHTFLTRTAAQQNGLASGYYPFFGLPIPWEIPFVRAGVPSGFMYASAEDLGHLLTAELNEGRYRNAQVVTAAGMGTLHEPLLYPQDTAVGWTMGFWASPLWEVGSLVSNGNGTVGYHVPVIFERDGDAPTYASGLVITPDEGWGVAVVMNLNDEAVARFHQLQRGIMSIVLGGSPFVTDYVDTSREAAKYVLPGLVLLQLVGIGWAIRNLRRWRRNPDGAPHGLVGLVRHLGLPLVVDLAIVTAVLGLMVSTFGPRVEVLWVLPRWFPDLGFGLLLIVLVGLTWVVATVMSAAALRQSRQAPL
jgi:CubicO group peptidase (beta-lactamase class C family)